MRRIFQLVLLLILSQQAIAQFPTTSTIGAASTSVGVRGALRIDSLLQLYNFTDTATANLGLVDQIPGAEIRAGGYRYMRNATATKWVQFATSETAWLTTGNYGTSPPVNYFGTNDFSPIAFKINGKYAGYISTGIPWVFSSGPDTISGSVVLGREAFQKFIDSVSNGNFQTGTTVAIGHQALKEMRGGENTAIGLGAMRDSRTGWRNTVVGEYTAFQGWGGTHNAYFGVFAGEVHSGGVGNTGLGAEALRGNKQGSYNTGVGFWGLYQQTTVVSHIIVTNGGSGYTNATVTISGPEAGTPGVSPVQATATAVLDGGAVTAITMTNVGKSYSNEKGAVTVTITGDGEGATAVAVLSSASENVGVGFATLAFQLDGKQNTALGTLAGYGIGGASQSLRDSGMLFVGYGSGKSSSASASRLFNGSAIGYGSTVAISSAMVLGSATYPIKVGVNTDTPVFGLHVVESTGAMIDSVRIDARGLVSGEQTSLAIGIGTMAGSTAQRSTAIGYQNQISNTLHYNTSVGYRTLMNINHFQNTAVGALAMSSATSSFKNDAFGANSMEFGTSNVTYQSAFGNYSLRNVSTGSMGNAVFGNGSGANITTGSGNVAIGWLAMGNSTPILLPGTAQQTGSNNIGVGQGVMPFLTSGSQNIVIGFGAAQGFSSESYNVVIGGTTAASIIGKSRWIVIADGAGSDRVYIDSVGNIGHGTSSPQRFLHNVGTVRFASLGSASNDTTTYKPLGIDSNGDLIPMDGWHGGSSYTFSTGLTESSGTVTNNLSTGIASGQTMYGGVAQNEDLTIEATSHSTKTSAYVNIQPTGGNVGIGTITPSSGLLQISSTTATNLIYTTGASSTVRFRVEGGSNGAVWIESHTGDQNAQLYFGAGSNFSDTRPYWLVGRLGGNPSNFYIRAQKTGGVFDQRLEMQPSGPTTFNPEGKDFDFIVEGDTDASLFYGDASANSIGIGTSSPQAQFHTTGSVRLAGIGGAGAVQSDADGDLSVTSDRRLKLVDGYLHLGLNEVLQIDPIIYRLRHKPGGAQYGGLDALQIYDIVKSGAGEEIAELVAPTNKDGFHGLNDRAVMGMLVNSIKELECKNQILETRIARLEAFVESVKSKP